MRFVPGLGFALGMLRHTSGYTANPEQVQENLSFGHHGEIWTADHRHVSGFQLSGEHGHLPEIHSDRIIMTPPWPGNKRSALWADNSELDDQWSVEMEFRVTGPDRGSGNMQLWYVKDQHEVGTSSLYTVGKWDGLGIIIDQYGGHGGTIRGFLNDHQVSYKDHHHVDQLSFASCDFSFRNLGRFVHLEVKQTRDSFEVNVDHHQCFKTHKIHTPKNNHFGVTAASSDNPDSFEIRSFVVRKISDTPHAVEHHDPEWHDQTGTTYDAAVHHDPHKDTSAHHTGSDTEGWYWTEPKEHIPDKPADSFKTEQDRFGDLHDRIALLGHQLDIIFHDLTVFKDQTEERHRDLLHWMSPTHNYAEIAMHTVERVEALVQEIKKDVEGKDYREHLEQLHHAILEGHQALPYAVGSAMRHQSPRMGFFIFIVIASQVMLFVSYVVYRRRKDSAPKKYL